MNAPKRSGGPDKTSASFARIRRCRACTVAIGPPIVRRSCDRCQISGRRGRKVDQAAESISSSLQRLRGWVQASIAQSGVGRPTSNEEGLVSPKTLEPSRRELGIPHGVLNIPVTQIELNRSGVMASVR